MDEGALIETAPMDRVLREHGSVEAYYLYVLRRGREAQPGIAPEMPQPAHAPAGLTVNAPDDAGGDGSRPERRPGGEWPGYPIGNNSDIKETSGQ
jgi:hypothetical protein